MKRLKILFGTAALLVAISGALVTKATTTDVDRYIEDDEEQICKLISTPINCTTLGTGCVDGSDQLFLSPADPSDPTKCTDELAHP